MSSVSRGIDRIEVTFDDPNLVANAGLLLLEARRLRSNEGIRVARSPTLSTVIGSMEIAFPEPRSPGSGSVASLATSKLSALGALCKQPPGAVGQKVPVHKPYLPGSSAAWQRACFQYEQVVLKKTYSQRIANAEVPSSLVSPITYVTGSPVALSVAMAEQFNPTFGEHGRTVWLLPRILSLVDSSVKAPGTATQFVLTPLLFNTYTASGDLWFDFGWPGVVLGNLLLGVVTVILERRARWRSSSTWVFYASAWAVILFASIIAFEVFWLQTVVWAVAGFVMFEVPRVRHVGSGVPIPQIRGSSLIKLHSQPRQLSEPV